MKVEEVSKLPAIERFLYWIQERHSIYKKRKAGKPKPWTDDEVLQSYFFTNPYRENDKTTVWFRENIRDPLKDKPEVLMATVIFRWFNRIETGELLLSHGLLTKWSSARAVKWLGRLDHVFTGAYMIKSPTGEKKLPSISRCVDNVWRCRKDLLQTCQDECKMQSLWDDLRKFPYLGGFMSYEIVCDLRYTCLLEQASDIDSWCHLGPGAVRGIIRLEGRGLPKNRKGKTKRKGMSPPKDWQSRMHGLLKTLRKRHRSMPRFEMREVEHSLCEWDKYERALWGDGGRLKRRYSGV